MTAIAARGRIARPLFDRLLTAACAWLLLGAKLETHASLVVSTR